MLDSGEREKEFMNSKVEYTDGPIEETKVSNDFLPSPDQLVLQEDTVKVTLSLSRKSVEFFKLEAKKNRTKYQKMIRNLLDQYTQIHSQ